MNFLEKLGKDDVKQTKRRGKKLIVIDDGTGDSKRWSCWFQDSRRSSLCDRPTDLD